MTTVVYADVLFLVNWTADAMILILTGRLLKRRILLWKVSMAAGFGALWGCLCGIFGSKWIQWSGLLPAALCMLWICYPSKHAGEILRGLLSLFLSAVLLGGLIHVIYENTLLGDFWRTWMRGHDGGAITLWLLAAAMLSAFIAIDMGVRYGHASRSREQLQEVTLYYHGRQKTVTALWDSGNQLLDPYSGKAVHIMESTPARELLGTDIAYRLVPCRSMGGEHTLIPVTSITRLRLASGVSLEEPLIGLSPISFSSDSSYQMLLHAQTDEMRRNV